MIGTVLTKFDARNAAYGYEYGYGYGGNPYVYGGQVEDKRGPQSRLTQA